MAVGKISQTVEVKVTGLDDVKSLEKELDKLDGSKTKTTVDIDTKLAQKSVDEFINDLKGLSQGDYTVLLGLKDAQLQEQLAGIKGDIATLDGTAVEITAKIEQANQVQADIDQIEAKIKEVNGTPLDVDTTGVVEGTSRAKHGIDEVGKSAESSKSVLANMIGNATQDLGNLGGVAGSAGVAIGQMGEYMADAAGQGEKLGSVISSFGKVALPIAGIALLTAGVTSVIGAYKKQAEEASKVKAFDTENAALYGKLAGENKNIVQGYADAARQAGAVKVAPNAAQETAAMRILGDGVKDISIVMDRMKKQGDPFDGLKQGTEDITPLLTKAKISADDFYRASSNPAALASFTASVRASGLSLSDQEKLLAGALYQTDQYAAGQADAAQKVALLPAALTTSAEMLKIQGDAMAEFSARQAGLAANDERVAKDEAATQALAAFTEQQKQSAEAARQWAIDLSKADDAIGQLASSFALAGSAGDALQAVFTLGDAPLIAAGSLRDITIAIDGLSEAAKGIDLSKPLDPSNVKADKLLDALDALRPQIQAKITEAFSTGGSEAATKMANDYIDKVVKELGGKLSRDEVAKLLGLDNIEANVAVALNLDSVAKARKQLDILTGLNGETPFTANIALALDAGTITGDQAQALIQQKLQGVGVTIPTALQVPETPETLKAAQDAVDQANPVTIPMAADVTAAQAGIITIQKEAGNTTATLPTAADPAGATADVKGFTDSKQPTATVPTDANTLAALGAIATFAASEHPAATIPTKADTSGAATGLDAFIFGSHPTLKVQTQLIPAKGIYSEGGVVGSGGGIAGEAGAEFATTPQGQTSLLTGPTVVPQGTVVTSANQTANLLGGLTVVEKAQPTIVYVTINTGVIGNRYDLDRTVRRSVQNGVRLAGTRTS